VHGAEHEIGRRAVPGAHHPHAERRRSRAAERSWVREKCLVAESTAALYQQLARHRDEIEAAILQGMESTLRAARRLISNPRDQDDADNGQAEQHDDGQNGRRGEESRRDSGTRGSIAHGVAAQAGMAQAARRRRARSGSPTAYAKAAQSWRDLLLDLKRRGLSSGPQPAVGDDFRPEGGT
jgi:hypothetical protein